MSTLPTRADVIVVGGGNAALCAAISAASAGASVLVLEAASRGEAGGNSWFTDGAMRFAIESPEALSSLLRLPAAEAESIVVPPYPAAQYEQDLLAAAGDAGDARLLRVLAESSYDTMCWLRDNDVPLELVYDNQSHKVDGKHHFFGNLNVRVVGRGIGMIKAETARCAALGVRVEYACRAVRLLTAADGAVRGVVVQEGADGAQREVTASAVVLACGGFEANAELRAQYLGEHWRNVCVRGSRHNQGAGLEMALAAGAARAGAWDGCHAVGTDANSPSSGDVDKPGDIWKKHSYPYGLLVNKLGRRYVDEGADLRNYTYAKYGKEILNQPGQVAFQLFDSQTAPLLRSEYRHEFAASVQAESLRDLAAKAQIDAEALEEEVAAYNAAVQEGVFNPAVLDGKRTAGLAIEKSNWALPLSQPPFFAFPIVCGITFTFGGLAVDAQAAVQAEGGGVMKNLYAAGEMVGGLFGNNYPGGSGLMSGAVFGRIAGASAACGGR